MAIDLNSTLCSPLMLGSEISNKSQVVEFILRDQLLNINNVINKVASGFAPSNIALCKYWGKRSVELNLPVSSSLSISLGNNGTLTYVSVIDAPLDQIMFNGKEISSQEQFYKRTVQFLNLFKNKLLPKNLSFKVDTYSNLPISAGLASSASGFAALVKALDQLFNWNLSLKYLSILARLGSGSACRSLFHGFVKWHRGVMVDGMDSFAESLDVSWPGFCVGLLILDQKEKYLSSREAMLQSEETSPFFNAWQELGIRDLNELEIAIKSLNFGLLGKIAEANSLAMHAVMLATRSSILYSNQKTLINIKKIWQIRHQYKIELYFTQDAGPNLKLLFLEHDLALIKKFFPKLKIIKPFDLTVTSTPFPIKRNVVIEET